MSFIRFKGISGQSLFWKCYCLFFSGAQNQCTIPPFQNCYIKMSWHMCLKCKIYKKEKNPLNVDCILLSPILYGTKTCPFSFIHDQVYMSSIYRCVWRMPCFLLELERGFEWSFSGQPYFPVPKDDFSFSTSCERLLLILCLITSFLAIQTLVTIWIQEYKESTHNII